MADERGDGARVEELKLREVVHERDAKRHRPDDGGAEKGREKHFWSRGGALSEPPHHDATRLDRDGQREFPELVPFGHETPSCVPAS